MTDSCRAGDCWTSMIKRLNCIWRLNWRICMPGVYLAKRLAILVLIDLIYWSSLGVIGVHPELLAFTSRFWSPIRFSGVQPGFLAFSPAFWRSNRFSGVHSGFLAFAPRRITFNSFGRSLQIKKPSPKRRMAFGFINIQSTLARRRRLRRFLGLLRRRAFPYGRGRRPGVQIEGRIL